MRCWVTRYAGHHQTIPLSFIIPLASHSWSSGENQKLLFLRRPFGNNPTVIHSRSAISFVVARSPWERSRGRRGKAGRGFQSTGIETKCWRAPNPPSHPSTLGADSSKRLRQAYASKQGLSRAFPGGSFRIPCFLRNPSSHHDFLESKYHHLVKTRPSLAAVTFAPPPLYNLPETTIVFS